MPNDPIAEYAYFLWERRGGVHGNDLEDWLEAERLLTPKFDVVLTCSEDNKIGLVRELRARTGLELTTAKDLVEDLPKPVGRALGRQEAEKLAGALEAAGGAVRIELTSS
jgi:ribosomal protein L7/L12